MPPAFRDCQVTVVGLGLMGGSLAGALRGRCRAVTGVARRSETVESALSRGLIDRGTTDLADAVVQADVVVLSTPVRVIMQQMAEIGSLLPEGCLLLDLGSTKVQIMAEMARLPEHVQPLGGHPMCGKEVSGLDVADPALYRGCTFILTPLARTSPAALQVGQQLARAVGANPRSVEGLLGLGIQAEVDGRLAEAERYLLAAARVDRGYDPRWALLNFYFRRGRWVEFWRWGGEACSRAYGDLRPVFDLYWKTEAGAVEIFERGVARSGRRAVRAYFYYLVGRGELDAAGAAAKDAEELRAYGEALLRAGRGRAALAVWEGGFGWRVREVEGAPVILDAARGEIRVTFSGRQPESCEPLWRYAAMEPGARYRLRFRYRTEGVEAGAGLRMVAGETAALDLGSEEWTEAQMEIAAGEADLGRAALRYRRARGYTRIAGAVWVRDFRWERVR